MKQGKLFATTRELPAGFVYEPDFITKDEEIALLNEIRSLSLTEAKYRIYTAKRRIVSYGDSYDFSSRELLPAGPVPRFLHPLRERIAVWSGIPDREFMHALIAEYRTGTPLGWHRDVPDFEVIVGVSLGSDCRMRLRPYPPQKGKNPESLSFNLERRSVYLLRGEARWAWQHHIPAVKAMRYSITFRTRSEKR
jgi:alkylated DNA repair dioxygenase AlkB